MLIIRAISAITLLTIKTPVVRVMLFLCLGALSKTTAAAFIDHLPMDNITHAVFIWLQYVALVGFCFEVIRYVWTYEVGRSIRTLFRRLKGK